MQPDHKEDMTITLKKDRSQESQADHKEGMMIARKAD
jgi:hypothetical protein